jgi:hypothetical protein
MAFFSNSIIAKVTASDGAGIIIQPDSPTFEVTSGQILIDELKILNNGSIPITFEVSYSSNLEFDENTIGLWYFNSGNGTKVKDEMGNNNGSIFGASWTGGKYSGALNFDGINDYVVVPNNGELEPESISIETWVKLDSTEYWTPIGGIKYEGYGLYYRGDGVFRTHVWGPEQGLKWYDSARTLELDKWYYIAMTYDSESGELALYVDGVKIESRFEGSDVIFSSPTNLLFGRGWTETSWDLFDGSIDEIRISNISRDKIEIAENYQRALTGNGEWLRFNETTGHISANSTESFQITLDATNLQPGKYVRKLHLGTNDSLQLDLTIPITLQVEPAVHDIATINTVLPDIYIAGQPLQIEADIINLGTFTETEMSTILYINGEVIDIASIPTLLSGTSIHQEFTWTADRSGIYYITIYAAPFKEDHVKSNNVFSAPITIIGQPDLWVNTSSLELSISLGHNAELNIIIANNGTDNLDFQITDTFSEVILFDDMEIGENGWIHEGSFDSWEYGEPLIGPRDAFSGQYLWGTSLFGNYEDSSNCSLVTESINLNNRRNPTLSFKHWYSFEDFEDYGYVEIWNESRWIKLSTQGYTGESRLWLHESYDISPYVDKLIKIRFRLQADDQIRDKGWYIDDVYIHDSMGAPEDSVTEHPQSGEILPNSYEIISVTVDASKLQLGEYQEFISIRSNDPNETRLIIPFKIYVIENAGNGSISGDEPIEPAHGEDTLLLNEDELIIFNSSKYFNVSEIIDFTWTFEDAGLQVLKGVSPTYVFDTPGIYQVTLVVTDYYQGSFSLNVTVKDTTAPTPDMVPELSTHEDEPVIFDGSRSYDNVGISNFTWTFEDAGLQVLKGVSPTYVFDTPGIYQVTLVVTDYLTSR